MSVTADIAQIRQDVASLRDDFVDLRTEMRQGMRLLTLLSQLSGKLSGSENLNQTIRVMQKAIRTAMYLRIALAQLQAARMAAGDPLAWITFGITAATFAADIGMEMYGV